MMNQQQSQLRTFRYWLSTLTFAEISIYVVMLVTFIGGLASIFFGIEFALLGILALLLTIVWYQLETTKRTHQLLEAEKIEIISRPGDIFLQGISTLDRGYSQGGWKRSRLFSCVCPTIS